MHRLPVSGLWRTQVMTMNDGVGVELTEEQREAAELLIERDNPLKHVCAWLLYLDTSGESAMDSASERSMAARS